MAAVSAGAGARADGASGARAGGRAGAAGGRAEAARGGGAGAGARADVGIIVDETVLLRYLLNDDARKSEQARRLISGGNVRTYPETIARTVTVLAEHYNVPRSLIGNVVELLLDDVLVEDEPTVRLAARLYGSAKLDFDACLMGARSIMGGYRIESFDRAVARLTP